MTQILHIPFYDDITTALQQKPSNYNLVIGDFNSKLATRENNTETYMRFHGLCQTSERR